MMPRSPAARILIVFNGLDALFTPLFAYAYFVLMGIDEGPAARTAITVLAVLWPLKVLTWSALTAIRLRPLAAWPAERSPPPGEETIRQVGITAYRAPWAVGLSWSAAASSLWVLTTLVLYVGFPDAVPLGPRNLEALGLLGLAILLGSIVLSFPLVDRLVAPLVEHVSLTAIERGVEIPGRGLSFRGRLVVFALTFALTPTLYLSAVAFMNDVRAGQRQLEERAQRAAAEEAFGNPAVARALGGRVFTFDAAAADLDGPEAARALGGRPALTRALARIAAAGPSGAASHPREGVVAFRAQGERRIGVVVPGPAAVSSGTVVIVLLLIVIVIVWVPLSASFAAGSTARPVARLSEALARVGAGEVESAPRVPVLHQDEIGALAKAYNAMLEQLRELARRATEISHGALDVELKVRGELGDAFRGQLASLREIVGHIAHGASLLAGAAAEMYAATQEQEQAAHQQSAGIEEVSRTMESLLVAATHVTESTTGVLTKAERTRETTARTAARITELSAHAGRIGEILEVIREIADRSDLLALNASLEGTRAGEAGRGFALVAAEMRKLAERVTASVGDIKQLVADVRASVSSTAIATDESSMLAEGTTESARQIHLVTQQQRSGTEQAGQSMRDVASMITQSLASTQQIRTLAEDLKAQSDTLTGLVARFRLPPPRPAP